MTAFEDLYSETEAVGTFWVGQPGRIGELAASSAHVDQHGRPTYYASFFYDGETGTLRLGDAQLGLPGKIIVGRVSDTAQGILLDGQGGKITLGGRTAGNGTVTVVDRFGTVVGVLDAEDARLTLGGGSMPGTLIVRSMETDQHGTELPWDSFLYDGATATLKIGNPQLGNAGRVVIGALSGDNQAILLDGSGGHVTLGGDNAGNGTLTVKNRFGAVVATLDAEDARLMVGGGSTPGSLIARSIETDQHGTELLWDSFLYDGATATLKIGNPQLGNAGRVVIGALSGDNQAILLDGSGGHVTLGGDNAGNGTLTFKNRFGTPVGVLEAETATLTLGHAATRDDEDVDGMIYLRSADGDDTVVLDGRNGNLTLGGGGAADGDLTVLSAGGKTAMSLTGSDATMTLGGSEGMNGDIVVKNGDDVETIRLTGSDGTITLGGAGVNGDIFIKNDNDIETIKIFGSIGDIEFLNADLAEEFEVERAELDAAAPGTVMVLTDDGTLAPCAAAYDGRVVGVVAGAGDHRPGIVMDKSGGENRVPIALVGKAFCLADASDAPIAVGDLLTTSPRAGHAMKAGDRLMAVGSVIGKALAPLPAARGLIPVLVMTR